MALKFSTALKNQLLGSIKGAVSATASLEHCVGRLYSGTQPTNADAAVSVSATLLLTFTVSSGTWSAGTNGLDFDVVAGVITKSASEIWSGIAVADNNSGGCWIRFCKGDDPGILDSTYIYPRIDCRVSTSGAEATLSSLSIVTGATVTLDSFSAAFPSTL